MGALFLASKLEECFVRMTHLITVYDLIIRKMKGQSIKTPLDAFSQVRTRKKNKARCLTCQTLTHMT